MKPPQPITNFSISQNLGTQKGKEKYKTERQEME